MQKIYFDNAATTAIDPEVLKEMMPYLKEKYGNASSLHGFGQEAANAVEQARKRVADFLVCKDKEIIFTSGATESDNLAIRGVCETLKSRLNKNYSDLHIITSSIEHPAVLETCQYLEKIGVKFDYLPVTKDGLVVIETLKKAINAKTVLVSIMYVNNEIGTIQPIAEIAGMLKNLKQKIYFHTDAVQAVNCCNCNVDYLGVDLLSLSAHKIYGPKGIGALYVRKGTPIKNIQYGGHHEQGIRSGTLNVAGIVGLGKAVELVKKEQKNIVKFKKLKEKLIKGVKKLVPDVKINGHTEKSAPFHINFSFKNIEGESIMLMLDLEGISVSTGSACASGSLKPSHVLSAIGVDPEIAHGSIRISLGKYNTEAEIDKFLKVIPAIINKLKKMSPLK